MKRAKTILISALLLIFIVLTIKDMTKIKDLTGNVYSYLTVTSFSHKEVISRSNRPYYWNCECVCGNPVTVTATNLKSGNVKSCGCKRLKLISDATTKHGFSYSREYKIWQAIKDRCSNHKNKRYGGRGITVCQRWVNSFENFYADMGPSPSDKHSIDRKNNNGNYTPDNCRWATTKEQCNNMVTNVIVKYQGITSTLTELCDRLNLNYNVIRRRVSSLNWTIDDAIKTKIKFRPKKSSYV